METKKINGRGRPKKDFGEFKEKVAKAAENRGKLSRGRPRKEIIAHKIISEDTPIITQVSQEKNEKISKMILICSIIFFAVSLIVFFSKKYFSQKKNTLEFTEINIESENNKKNENTEIADTSNINDINIEIGYNDENGEFIGLETLDIDSSKESGTTNDSNISLIKSFYDKINNKDFDSLKGITDKYLKESDSYKSYYNQNRLTRFLNKIKDNKIYISGIKEVPYEKANAHKYSYDIKYIQNSDQKLYQEQREIVIVNRNGENLIGSVMCVTTGCSKMPFFQP